MIKFLTDSTLTGWRYVVRQALLVAASVGFSLCFACAAPLVAFGVFAALTMKLRHALGFMTAAWLANQLVGYGLLDYPQTANSFAWGAAIGLASLGATIVAAKVATMLAGRGEAEVIGVSFIAALGFHQLALFAAGVAALGGMEGFAPEVIGYVAALNLAAFVGLLGYCRLERMATPALVGATQRVKF